MHQLGRQAASYVRPSLPSLRSSSPPPPACITLTFVARICERSRAGSVLSNALGGARGGSTSSRSIHWAASVVLSAGSLQGGREVRGSPPVPVSACIGGVHAGAAPAVAPSTGQHQWSYPQGRCSEVERREALVCVHKATGSTGIVITQRLAATRTPYTYPLDKLMRPERLQRLPQ